MKARTLLLSASILVLLASPAAARNGAWYVGGDFGGMLVDDINLDFGAGAPPLVPANSQIQLNHDYGYDGALFVGYDLGQFRIESEVAYKRATVDDIDSSIAIPPVFPTAFTGVPAGGGSTSALSFMVNGMLDFGDDDGISGFVGGGIGVARVDYNNIRTFSNHDVIDDSDTRFAWQVVAGVRQAITDNIDITLRYRFFNADNIRTVDFRGFDSDSRFRSHSLLGGITFNFGAPPPPPPPPPPPAPPATETPAETPH
jgi:opacity protein-like surface antigen